MPFTETITIINNSGKIISTGKHLVGLFKDAKAAYKEKKAVLDNERAIQRAYTYDVPVRSSSSAYHPAPPDQYYYEVQGQSLADDDDRSRASSYRSHRSHRSSRTERTERTSRTKPRPALTEANLDMLSEVSGSRASSQVSKTYRAPYAETVSKSMVLSRPDLARAPTAPTTFSRAKTQSRGVYSGALDPSPMYRDSMAVNPPSVYLPRASSEPNLVHDEPKKKKKEIDMNLAYGSMPPDLADRVDLDPNYEPDRETQVQQLVDKIEGILDEAQCVHHSANTIISMLQDSPERAAAVALTLAELSTLLGKMTPAFAGIIKSGSPAVFGLLASPQFLIAAGVAVGVTIVMFGGWKIVKRIKEAKQAESNKLAFEMGKMNVQEAAASEYAPPPCPDMGPVPEADYYYDNPPFRHNYPEKSRTEVSHDDAIVLDDVEELSTIESWRRGIVPFGEDGSADMELISPEADRVMRQRFRESQMEFDGDDRTVTADDSVSRAGSRRTHRTHKSSRRSKSHAGHRSSRLRDEIRTEVPERNSSKDKGKGDDDTRSRHSGHSSQSHRSERSHRSSRTEKRPSTRVTMKAIEDGSRDKENTLASVLGKDKESSAGSAKVGEKEKKAANMLKAMFKRKKEREEKERTGSRLVFEIA